jgi:hypothetical protein
MMNKKEYEDKTLNLIEKSQLTNSANDVDVRALAKDITPDEFTSGFTDAPSDMPTKTDSEMSPHYPETTRFCKNHEPIDEEAIKKGLGLKDVKSGGGTN